MDKEDNAYFDHEEVKGSGEHSFQSTHAKVYNRRLLIAMVGLPARGKTFISRKVTRYLTWLGYNAKVFNIGDKRRKVLGVEDTAQSEFFDPKNKEGMRLREQLAEDTLTDIVKFLNNGTGNIAVFDGTNTTKKRRKKVLRVLNTYLPETDFFFLEVICNDEEQIKRNLLRTKIYSPDFIGWDQDKIIEDFRERITKYESVYEEVGCSSVDATNLSKKLDKEDPENSIPYIKIINNNERVISQNIQGFLNLQIVTFLLHLHLTERPLYFLRHGESEFILEDRIGGDPSITKDGTKFAKLLNNFFEEEIKKHEGEKFTVYTSTLKRTIQTAKNLDSESDLYDIQKPLKLLDEIHAGI